MASNNEDILYDGSELKRVNGMLLQLGSFLALQPDINNVSADTVEASGEFGGDDFQVELVRAWRRDAEPYALITYRNISHALTWVDPNPDYERYAKLICDWLGRISSMIAKGN